MRVSVIGAGHVGLVTAACLASVGHEVRVNDDDPAKLAVIREGRPWFYEPGLQELIAAGIAGGRLLISADKAESVAESRIIFICVGTPSREDGSPNLEFVEAVSREVARLLPPGEFRVICEKSTVPVQTGELVARAVRREAPAGADFEIASNPEFLREGAAVEDTLRPDRVVVGTDSERGTAVLRDLYQPILDSTGCPFLVTDRATAELIKHASNAFLATKISFINSVARVCERSGADVELVALGMGLDPRIGPQFLRAGAGYGGSCFPKDVAAFAHRCRELGADFRILHEVANVNTQARQDVVERVREALWHLSGKRVAVLGLAFKPETDDLRDAPAIAIVRELLDGGAEVVGYDPAAGQAAAALVPGLRVTDKAVDAVEGAHAVVLVTEWKEFAELDALELRGRMAYPILVDGRNFLDADAFVAAGFTVAGVGRQVRAPEAQG